MITEEKCYIMTCDKCNAVCNEQGYADRNDVLEAANDYEWYVSESNQYCPDCYEMDDNDQLILK
ncbi:MAG: hypothetical protein LBI60_05810 [Bacteroidales bacterium]|jgi:hypothetical protein|nr:hypothetical protein [Bacteroidales bacterium]